MKVFTMTASTGRTDPAGLSFYYLSLVLAPWCTEGGEELRVGVRGKGRGGDEGRMQVS
jgi:hypothetical protein